MIENNIFKERMDRYIYQFKLVNDKNLLPYVSEKEKTKYMQDWKAYNFAQTKEFSIFQDILIELLDSLLETKRPIRQGRLFNDLKEIIFCSVIKAYFGKSSRRSVSFLELPKAKGYINKIPHFNTILNYYEDESITPILKHLIE